MRQGQNSKRSRGRGSGRRSNVPTRHQTFDSNGPSVRIRGNAYQVYEKYLAMARDATAAGDRITAENFLQHAEHYFRIINADGDGESRNRINAQRAAEMAMDNEDDGDQDGDAGEAVVEAVNGSGQAVDAGDGEQPTVAFPNGHDGEDEAPEPRKSRAPRTPRTPRGMRAARGRPKRDAGNEDDSQPPLLDE